MAENHGEKNRRNADLNAIEDSLNYYGGESAGTKTKKGTKLITQTDSAPMEERPKSSTSRTNTEEVIEISDQIQARLNKLSERQKQKYEPLVKVWKAQGDRDEHIIDSLNFLTQEDEPEPLEIQQDDASDQIETIQPEAEKEELIQEDLDNAPEEQAKINVEVQDKSRLAQTDNPMEPDDTSLVDTKNNEFKFPDDFHIRIENEPVEQRERIKRLIKGYKELKSTDEEIFKLIDPLLPKTENEDDHLEISDIAPFLPDNGSEAAGRAAHKIELDLMLVNGTSNVRKNASEIAREFLTRETKRGSGLNPLNWGRKTGLKMLEPYWKQKIASQIQLAALENNAPYATLDIAASSIKLSDLSPVRLTKFLPKNLSERIFKQNLKIDTESKRDEGEAEELAEVERARLAERLHRSDRITKEASSEFNQQIMDEIIKPFAKKDSLTKDDKKEIQEKLKTIISNNLHDNTIEEIFGKKSNEYREVADHFATDIEDTIENLRADYKAHNTGIESLDEWLEGVETKINIKLSSAHWGTASDSHFDRTDKLLAKIRENSKSTILANPAAAGAVAALGTYLAIRATGYGIRHAATFIPGVGLGVTFGLSFFKNFSESKTKMAEYKTKKTYGGLDESKEDKSLSEFSKNSVTAKSLLEGDGENEGINVYFEKEYDFNNKEIIKGLAFMTAKLDARLDYAAQRAAKGEQIDDVITFSSKTRVAQEMLELEKALIKAGDILVKHNYSEEVYNAEKLKYDKKLQQNEREQRQAYNKRRLQRALFSSAVTTATSLAGGFVAKTALDELGINPFKFTRESLRPFSKIKNIWNERQGDIKGLHLEVDQNNNVVVTKNGENILDHGLRLNSNGTITARADVLPGEKMDEFKFAGFDIHRGLNVDTTFLQPHDAVNSSSLELDGKITETVIPENTYWLQKESGLELVSLDGKVIAKNVEFVDGNVSFEAVGKVTKIVEPGVEIAPTKTLGLEEIWDRNSTEIVNRRWHPESQFQVYDSVFTASNGEKGVVIDLSKIAPGHENKAIAITIAGHEQSPIVLTDASDGVLDDKITLDPSENFNHVFEDDNESITVADLSKSLLNESVLKDIPDGELGSQYKDMSSIYNLAVNGEPGHIEAGFISQDSAGKHLEVFATANGTGEVPIASSIGPSKTPDVYKFSWTEEIHKPTETYTLTPFEEPVMQIKPETSSVIIPFGMYIGEIKNPIEKHKNKILPTTLNESLTTGNSGSEVETDGQPAAIPQPITHPAIEEIYANQPDVNEPVQEEELTIPNESLISDTPPLPITNPDEITPPNPAIQNNSNDQIAQTDNSATIEASPEQPQTTVSSASLQADELVQSDLETNNPQEPISEVLANSQDVTGVENSSLSSRIDNIIESLPMEESAKQILYQKSNTLSSQVNEILKSPDADTAKTLEILQESLMTASQLASGELIQTPKFSYTKSQVSRFMKEYYANNLSPEEKDKVASSITNIIEQSKTLREKSTFEPNADRRRVAFATISLAAAPFIIQATSNQQAETPQQNQTLSEAAYNTTAQDDNIPAPAPTDTIPPAFDTNGSQADTTPAPLQTDLDSGTQAEAAQEIIASNEQTDSFESAGVIDSNEKISDETRDLIVASLKNISSNRTPDNMTQWMSEKYTNARFGEGDAAKSASKFLSNAIANNSFLRELTHNSPPARQEEIFSIILAARPIGIEGINNGKKPDGLIGKLSNVLGGKKGASQSRGQFEPAPSGTQSRISRRTVLSAAAGAAVFAAGSAFKSPSGEEMARPQVAASSTQMTMPAPQDAQEVFQASEQLPQQISETLSTNQVWSARENAPYEENGKIQVWPAQHLDGTIELNRLNESGEWETYNNIVPVAKTPLNKQAISTEEENIKPERIVVDGPDGTKIARYQYPRMSNGARFYIDVALSPKSGKASVTLGINDDSEKIESFTPGNFLGMADMVQQIDTGISRFDAKALPTPNDGAKKFGSFSLPIGLSQDKEVVFSGDKLIQKQKLIGASGFLAYEVRRHAWMPGQKPARNENWFEAVQIIATNPPKEGATWTFEVEKK